MIAMTIDIGTSSTRVLFWDTAGNEIEGIRAQVPYTMRLFADGGQEMNPEDLIGHIGECVDSAMAQIGNRASEIGVVGLSAFWHAVIGLDSGGVPVTPLFNWADTRSGAVAHRLRKDLDEKAIHQRTGCVIHSSYYPSKIVWVRETRRAEYDRVAVWVSPSEYLFRRWFGKGGEQVSLSMASGTGLLNQNLCAWDTKTLAAISLPVERLAPIGGTRLRMQGLQEEFAVRWPALRDVPFLPAVGDGACGNVGSGCVTPERFAINFGTSGAIRAMWREESGQRTEPHAKTQRREEENSGQSSVVGDQKIRAEGTSASRPQDDQPKVSGATALATGSGETGTSVPGLSTRSEDGSFIGPDNAVASQTGRLSSPDDASTPPGLWRYRANGERPVMGAAFSDAGNAYAWLNRTLKLPPEAELEGYLLAMEPAAHGLTVLPFLAGERSMGWNPDARAVFAGLTLDTSPIEITQAVLESIALRFALAAERLRSVFGREQEIVVSGGAFRESRILPQIFADVLGCPITLAEEPEASSRGAALLAMEAVGMIDSVESVEARRGHTVAPNPAHQGLYQAMLARQQEQYTRNFSESV